MTWYGQHQLSDLQPVGTRTPDAADDVLKKRAEPYTKIVAELRRETVHLVRQAVRRAYVLVNNRAEGNAPLTVRGLSEMLRG